MHGLRGDKADTVGPGADLIHGRARCQGCAVPLRHHALIVIGIDGIGDHAALRALEFLGGHPVLDEIGDDRVDPLFELREAGSGTALGWGILCLTLYKQDVQEWKKILVKNFEKTRFLGEIKAVALALLAVGNGASLFRV